MFIRVEFVFVDGIKKYYVFGFPPKYRSKFENRSYLYQWEFNKFLEEIITDGYSIIITPV